MLVQADAFQLPYPDDYFHSVITSPPYRGLRKYSGDQGDEPLGLEATPERHIERIVEICREVWRVLRPDGVFWLNYGDCYSSSPSGSRGDESQQYTDAFKSKRYMGEQGGDAARIATKSNVPAGNLMLMPHRIAIALQEDGWLVRQDLVWSKPNPMPESVSGWRWEQKREEKNRIKDGGVQAAHTGSFTNLSGGKDKVEWEYSNDYVLRTGSWRHTRQHEYFFMLTKGMKYWCNQEAVREPSTQHPTDWKDGKPKRNNFVRGEFSGKTESMPGRNAFRKISASRNPRSVIEDDLHEFDKIALYVLEHAPWIIDQMVADEDNPASVLEFPTATYKGEHFATFSPNLIARLIRASVPRWCCPECGKGWAPIIRKDFVHQVDVSKEKGIRGHQEQKPMDQSSGWQGFPRGNIQITTLAYRPICECYEEAYCCMIESHPARTRDARKRHQQDMQNAWLGRALANPKIDNHEWLDSEPGIVLDIFGGSGTTGMVAKELLRRWVVMDISKPYIEEQAKLRTKSGTPAGALDGLPLFELMENGES